MKSTLPIKRMFAVLAMACLVVGLAVDGADARDDNINLATFTNGKESVIWSYARVGYGGYDKRIRKRDVSSALRCMVKREAPNDESAQQMFTSSDMEYEGHKKACSLHSRKKRQIFPGTKWCGAGNSASNDNDLGLFKKEDACCRAHDMCPRVLKKGEIKYGVTNNDLLSTISDCDCDNQFRNCLRDLNTAVSNAVGDSYFNVLFTVPCLKFASDTTATKVYKGNYVPKQTIFSWIFG